MRRQIVLTMSIRMMLPSGSNAAEALDYVSAALASHGGGMDPESPYFEREARQFTVNLTKKEITYG